MRQAIPICLSLALLVIAPAAAGEPPVREARWVDLEADGGLPPDLVEPEGHSRWDLTGLVEGLYWTRRTEPSASEPGVLRVTDREETAAGTQSITSAVASAGADDAAPVHWLFPDRDPALLDTATRIVKIFERRDGARSDRTLELRRVGVGWLHLPWGLHEVVLQRVVSYPGTGDGVASHPDEVIHRWIDPREGVVAEVRGPASADGLRRTAVSRASAVVETVVGKAGMRIYADELDRPPYARLAYGYDRAPDPGSETIPVSWLTPDAHAAIGDLITAGSWDFSGNTLANAQGENASTGVVVSSDETCNWDSCGFNRPGVKLGREDRFFTDPPNTERTYTVQEREDRANDVTIWVRAAVRNEGVSGGFGEGESRTCYVDDGRTEVPLWRFSHEDPGVGWYLELNDAWGHAPFACENNIFNHVCPDPCGALCPIFTKACGDYAGTQSTQVVAEGPVTLPSGHTFQAFVVRTVAEFCTYLSSTCLFPVQQVRTANHLWEVPRLGSVVRLESERNVSDLTSFTQLVSADVKYGLFPPLSVTAVVLDDDSIQISWDPGLDTRRIDDYRIYWDTDSGASSDYANSTIQPAASGTSVVLNGLAPGTEHFFTVTSLSDYANPSAGVPVTYESVRYPTSIPAVPNPLPVEVAATTSCTPQVEVSGVTVDKAAGGAIEVCWSAGSDPCLRAYEVLGADTPESPDNFGLVDEAVPPENCRVLDPSETYFQVRMRGVGAVGP